jgi:SOS-response transcriptional repressor LexA
MCYIMTKTPGEIIRDLREQRGLTQEDLAELVDVSQNYIALIESGKRQGKFILSKIAEALEVDVEVLHGDKPIPEYKPKQKPIKSIIRDFTEKLEAMEIFEVPIVGYIPAGRPRTEEGQNLGFVYPLKMSLRNVPNPDKLYALIVSGESLVGRGIHDGDRLLMYPVSDVDIQGKIYECVIDGDGVVARRVEKTKEGKYRLRAANEHYEDFEPDRLTIKGRAIKKIPPEEDL